MSDRSFEKYLNIHYNILGTKPEDGFNCWTFTQYFLLHEFDRDINKFLSFEFEKDIGENAIQTRRVIKAHCKDSKYIKQTVTPVDGDLCFMGNGSHKDHIGVYVNGGVIHCQNSFSGVGMVIFTSLTRLKCLYSQREFYEWLQ